MAGVLKKYSNKYINQTKRFKLLNNIPIHNQLKGYELFLIDRPMCFFLQRIKKYVKIYYYYAISTTVASFLMFILELTTVYHSFILIEIFLFGFIGLCKCLINNITF